MPEIFLSIIIPAYNEAKRLPDTLAVLRAYLERQKFTYEVVVVDDGSKDETVKLVKAAAEHFKGLRVIENSKNKGKGGVVRQGMLEAQGKWRLFTDADNSTPIKELDKLLKYTEDYQVIFGSRYLSGSNIVVKQPYMRRLLSRASNLLIQAILLPGIKDTQCGFKLFEAEAAQNIFNKQTMKGWSFDLELLTISRAQHFKIKEVPVEWFDDKRSKVRSMKAARESFWELLQIRRKLKKGDYK